MGVSFINITLIMQNKKEIKFMFKMHVAGQKIHNLKNIMLHNVSKVISHDN